MQLARFEGYGYPPFGRSLIFDSIADQIETGKLIIRWTGAEELYPGATLSLPGF